MPGTIPIAAFVLGAVLLLIAIVGGRFKIFGAEISGVAGRTGRIVAGLAGGLLISFGLLTSFPSTPRQETPETQPLGERRVAEQHDPEGWYHKGIALYVNGRYSDPHLAIEYFTKAARLDPVNANTYYARGIAYAQTGDLTAAIADYGKAITLYADDADYFNNRGAAYWQLGAGDKAKSDWERACSMGDNRGCENLSRFFQ
jgi:cytochrome c-type biogenesis protein CcmH/NrfG